MTETSLSGFDDRSERLFIHFDVNDHSLKLDTFIQTADSVRNIIDALDETFFQGSLQYELIVFPPEDGSFLSKLGFCVLSSLSAVYAFICTEPGAAFTKGLTGETPSYWFEQAGYKVLEEAKWISEQLTTDEANAAELKTDRNLATIADASSCQATARVVISMTRSLLEKNTDELSKLGMESGSLPDALDARADFYAACINNNVIKRIGFTPNNDFPIHRNSFPERAQKPTRNDEEEEQPEWLISIENIYVTSPNWDKEDQKTRQWKGKDQVRRNCYFVIEDAEFWQLVKKKNVHVEVLNNLKVQWARQFINGKSKNRRVLRVLELNGNKLAEPLTSDAIKAILGDYSYSNTPRDQPSLFDD
ncbi:hypothetical protein [Pseudovibrio sp. Ad37]|uniref:hypothetical protein n=1 Tax=Pseudovibrio sp. Ad37 TaxID=989422 RepID=UPI0007AEA2A0|nr:hypothetical protein [Pseudovibrio sp. Ad37]KZL27024.1 hypothetical protein PsAD37_01701 [Pseudovibrio sp. Ad37]